MSDERIFAEVVRADQIKAGDRIVWLDKVVTVKAIDRHGHRIELIYEDRACVPAMRSELVARLLPSPVEVRDVWRVKCTYSQGHETNEDYELQEGAIAAKAEWEAIGGVQIEIIPLRAVVLRREDGES